MLLAGWREHDRQPGFGISRLQRHPLRVSHRGILFFMQPAPEQQLFDGVGLSGSAFVSLHQVSIVLMRSYSRTRTQTTNKTPFSLLRNEKPGWCCQNSGCFFARSISRSFLQYTRGSMAGEMLAPHR